MKNNLDDVTIYVEDINNIPFDEIRNVVKEHTFARVKGLFTSEEILEANSRIKKVFEETEDVKHDPRDVDRMQFNMQKLTVGGTAGPSNVPRFLRMYYNPLSDKDIYGMREIFQKLTRFRNGFYNVDPDFTINGIEDGYWTNARINHYPKGGGFMAAHRDVGSAVLAEDLGFDSYLQILMIMSEKGKDFHTGGAFIDLKNNGERYYYEDDCSLGDVMLYDGRIIHGVEDVDSMEMLDLKSFDGRRVAFVTLLKHFQAQGNEEHLALLNRRKKSSGGTADGL